MQVIEQNKNNLFIEGKDILPQWVNESKAIDKIRVLLKCYLELDNVSFLFGTGSSIMLGARSIQSIPKEIEDVINSKDTTKQFFLDIVKKLQGVKDEEDVRRCKSGEIDYSLEELLNYLLALEYTRTKTNKCTCCEIELTRIIKQELFKLCDIAKTPLSSWISNDVKDKLSINRYFYHELFTKKLLQRPLNLKRANIFTTNYDLAFDEAFDHLGIHYINGFSGFHKRIFKPENFDYDIYFPGSTTQGKVQRIEKVLKYFKIHGSLTWVQQKPEPNNVYGIEELPIGYIREKQEISEDLADTGKENFWDNVMIYPSAAKKSYTLDYPYSELFRQFSATISQSQSVLITYGYSFSDDHINDLIFQALTIPSFTLIIVDFNGTKISETIKRLKETNDPRVIILQGNQLGDFPFFTENLLPDFMGSNTNEKITATLNAMYNNKTKEDELNTNNVVEQPLSDDTLKEVEVQSNAVNKSTDENADDLPF